MYIAYMASVCINVSVEAHERLKKLKGPGDSFSDVILRELPNPCDTAGELLDRLETLQLPRPDVKLRAAVLAGRGRRSKR